MAVWFVVTRFSAALSEPARAGRYKLVHPTVLVSSRSVGHNHRWLRSYSCLIVEISS
jgi:hypothetical protein